MMPVDNSGEPIPWLNYQTIEFLDERISSDHVLFEFGSGNSTIWFGKRANKVISVEHDPEWADRIESSLPENVDLLLRSEQERYINAIQTLDENGINPDIIVVDGDWRVQCIESALEVIGNDSVIILDDISREEYQPAKEKLELKGFNQLLFTGMKPLDRSFCSTAVFYRSQNCLDI